MNSTGTLLALGHPLVVTLIGLAVLALWRGDVRRPHYLLCFALSYFAYGFGVTSQILLIPANHVLNVIFSGLMYVFAAMFFARSVIDLSGAVYRYGIPTAIVVLSIVCRAYFLLVEADGAMRSYCLHAAVFSLFLHGAYVARGLRKGLLAERITFYAFVLFTLTTPSRMLLMTFRPTGSYGFDFSSYWVVTTVSIYAFSLVFGLALIITIIQRNHKVKQATDENLSLISHDLRAPLATIVGNLYLLQKSATPEQLAHMEAIERSTQYQISLIDDIVAGRQDVQPLDVKPELMSVEPFLAELDLHGRTWCSQHNTDFSLDILTTLPGQIHTDERRLKQVLLNLLSNAALATRNGNVELHVKMLSDEPGWGRICFEIHDTGHGIAANHQAKLFDAYQRFDHQRPGTGLGLYIAQRIASNLGGILDVRSQQGKGSCFSLVLRVPAFEMNSLPKGWQPASLLAGADDAAPEPQKKTIDDNPIQQEHFQHCVPPKDLCQQLASYACEGRYSDIQDWINSAALRQPRYQGFRSVIQGALDNMNFDKIQALAQGKNSVRAVPPNDQETSATSIDAIRNQTIPLF